MNPPLNFAPEMESLQELTLAKISRILWQAHSQEAASLIVWKRGLQHQLINDDNLDEACKVLKEKVKASELPIAIHFRRDLHQHIDNTWSEINESALMFLELMDNFSQIASDIETSVISTIFKHLPWACYNRMDHREMAKIVIRELTHQLSRKQRYRLACHFCLEEDIRQIWVQMHPEGSYIGYDFLQFIKDTEEPITTLWTYTINNKLRRLRFPFNNNNSPFEYIIDSMFEEELPLTEYAIKYLWSKLSDAQAEYLISTFKSYCDEMRNTGVLCFVLSKMNFQKQQEILSTLPGFFLEKFLRIGYQHLFMPILRVTWKSMDASDVSYIALTVDTEACPERIKKQFWEDIPEANCKHLYETFSQRRCLALLQSTESLKQVRRILKAAPELTVFLYILERCLERCLENLNIFPNCSTQNKLDKLNSIPRRETCENSVEKLDRLVPIIKDYLGRANAESWGALRKQILEYMEFPPNTEFQPWIVKSIPDKELETQISFTLEYLDQYLIA